MTHDFERWAAGLEEVLGVSPVPAALFVKAFTHPSFAHEQPGPRPGDNQRLEFLGDAVIDLAVAEILWRRFPNRTEGELARARAALVNTETLAACSRELGLHRWLRLGRGEKLTGGLQRTSTLCDVFEAVVGALFLAYGWDVAARFVLHRLAGPLDDLQTASDPGVDPKSRLQERLQREAPEAPEYVITEQSGPPHRREFAAEVWWRGERLGSGRGPTKRAAEQAAAAAAWARLAKKGNSAAD